MDLVCICRSFSAPTITSVRLADMWAHVPEDSQANPFAMAAGHPSRSAPAAGFPYPFVHAAGSSKFSAPAAACFNPFANFGQPLGGPKLTVPAPIETTIS